jgi:pimeloyl-ACP methyl ester carboxylesterase
MKNIAQTKIPVLAFFGENDKQADPIQGLTAYARALKDGGNQHSRVELIPGVDHNLVISPTGCISEWRTRTSEGWRNYSTKYLDILEEWLGELRQQERP